MLKLFLNCERGATAIEYGLLASVMGAALIGIYATFGDSVSTGFNSVGSNFANHTTE